MTATKVAVLTIGLAAAAAAQSNTNQTDEARTIKACMRLNGRILKNTNLIPAQHISKQIMATAGISLQWIQCGEKGSKDEVDAVIDVIADAPLDFHPGALAYALPFEGMHIVVMEDRLAFGGDRLLPVLLGHVISHELAHLLQGCILHSEHGIMKAHWTNKDYGDMLWRPMRFSTADAELIQLGLLRRQGAAPRTAAKAAEGAPPML
jgi:hypothetical protein